MAILPPTIEQLKTVADQCGLALSQEELSTYRKLMMGSIADYNLIEGLPDEVPPVKHPRTPGIAPAPEENPNNAWYRKTSISGADNGPLGGKRIAIKDNVLIAGVPMANGCSTLNGYIPEFDATIVTRILDAGAEIVGKTQTQSLCIGLSSHLNFAGPIHNPLKHGYSAGGSSSGSAVVVASGEADMAIGGDQGGSIRVPASCCGLYGLKPTWGLVPYTGIMPLEIMIDHTGPMTRTVEDNALLLEVIAGSDGYDSRCTEYDVPSYTHQLDGGVDGMKIGIVREGFGQPGSEEIVETKVRNAVKQFEQLGATVHEISIPEHLMVPSIWTPIGTGGLTATMMWGDGYGSGRQDLYPVSLMDRHRSWRNKANDLTDSLKLFLLTGTFIHNQYGTKYYGKALNIIRRYRRAFDEKLTEYDLLAMPTMPMTPQKLPETDCSIEEEVQKAVEPAANTSVFNVTHHPAMSVPCGVHEGLPIGMMLVGNHFEEAKIYRAAYAFEQNTDWRDM